MLSIPWICKPVSDWIRAIALSESMTENNADEFCPPKDNCFFLNCLYFLSVYSITKHFSLAELKSMFKMFIDKAK